MNRSAFPRLALAALLVGITGGCGDSGPTGSNLTSDVPYEPEHQPKKAWTFLFYDDAEFQGYDPLEDFRTRMRSGPNLHVLVLQDSESSVARTVSIGESGHITPVLQNGEVNMADDATLRDFVAFGKEYYPADRYILSFYDHGAAWSGSCVDETSGNDILTMKEKQLALGQVGGVDVVLFSAPCNMGSFEAAYNLRDLTTVYIGSPNTSGYVFWRDVMADLSLLLNTDPTVGEEELATSVIESVWAHKADWMPDIWQDALTMTAVRTDGMERLASALDQVSARYLDMGADLVQERFNGVSDGLVRYSTSLADLGDLASRLLAVEEDENVRDAVVELLAALEDVIICECHGTTWPDGASLNIFFPDATAAYRLPYYQDDYYGLDVVEVTRWDEILTVLHPSASSAGGWFTNPPAREWNPLELSPKTDGFSFLPGSSCGY